MTREINSNINREINRNSCKHYWIINSKNLANCKNCNESRQFTDYLDLMSWAELTEEEEYYSDAKTLGNQIGNLGHIEP